MFGTGRKGGGAMTCGLLLPTTGPARTPPPGHKKAPRHSHRHTAPFYIGTGTQGKYEGVATGLIQRP